MNRSQNQAAQSDCEEMAKLKYVTVDTDRHGNQRIYFRKRGQPKVRLRGPLGSSDFLKDYHAALHGQQLVDAPKPAQNRRPIPGTLRWLIGEYYKSPHFLELKDTTQVVRKRFLERVCNTDDGAAGKAPISDITREVIRAGRDRRSDTPTAANHFVNNLKQVFDFAVEADMMGNNPCHGVKTLKHTPASFHSWKPEECARFEDQWAVGTRQRMAYALLFYTGVRRSDAVYLGRQHLKDGMLSFRQQKTGKAMTLPVAPQLAQVIRATPTAGLSFIESNHGKPYSTKSFGMQFSKWCAKAGIPHCSCHGLRHALGNRMAEAGATPHQIAAALGHSGTGAVKTYTSAANQRVLAQAAHDLLAAM